MFQKKTQLLLFITMKCFKFNLKKMTYNLIKYYYYKLNLISWLFMIIIKLKDIR